MKMQELMKKIQSEENLETLSEYVAQAFSDMTDISLKYNVMFSKKYVKQNKLPAEKAHEGASKLGKTEQGVYVFLLDRRHCLKVGKAGCNSKARWDSHHYTLNRTSSSLPLSILNKPDPLKAYFDARNKSKDIKSFLKTLEKIHKKIENRIAEEKKKTAEEKKKTAEEKMEYSQFDEKRQVRKWIVSNFSRLEFILSGDVPDYAINLLEGFLQWILNPCYEGGKKDADWNKLCTEWSNVQKTETSL